MTDQNGNPVDYAAISGQGMRISEVSALIDQYVSEHFPDFEPFTVVVAWGDARHRLSAEYSNPAMTVIAPRPPD